MNEPGAGVSLPDSEWSRPVLLQQAREQAGLHIAALAAALKVPVRKLEALEAGRYDELPDLTFARALASSACRHLRMDPAPVLAQIPQGKRPVLGVVSDEALNTPFRPAREVAASSAQAGPARLVWWVAGLVLLAALAMYFWPHEGQMPFAPTMRSEPAVPAAPGSGPAGGGGAVQPAVVEVAPPPQPALPLLAPDNSSAAPITTAAEPPGPAEPVSQVAPDSSKLLVIRANNETWIEVINGSGGVAVQRVLRAGDNVDFSASPPYRVVVGRADAVEVYVRGQPFDVMPHARNSVARFEVR
jgi:cytoskeleton protein RodZ